MALWAWRAAAMILALGLSQPAAADENATSTTLDCSFGQEAVDRGRPHSNGSLVTDAGAVYPNGTWESSGDQYLVCKCVARPCFRKCCPEGKATDSNLTCVNIPTDLVYLNELRPAVFQENGLRLFIERNETAIFDNQYDFVYGFPPKPWYLPTDEEMERFYLLDDGTLAAFYGELDLDISLYCYAVMLDSDSLVPLIWYEQPDESTPLRFILYPIFMVISTPFLAATFVIYALVTRLHNTHGRCIMSHVLVLFVAYICLIVVNLHSLLNILSCITLAFIIYFAFLASFFWLNVMCLDIWWTFSGFRPMRGSVKEREHKKFIIYSLYCWGSPLIMLIICMVMDLHRGIPDTYIKPGFGELKCWFKSNLANFIYFSGPIAILIVCNIILFVLTAIKIRQVKRGTKILKKQDSRRHNEEEENNAQRFNLYFKLFLVMGVNWIMEIVSFAAGGPDEYWYITDIANTLQGVLIFIIFVWKDRIRKLLVERFCPGRAANTNSLANSSSTRTTGIRHNGSVMSSGRPSFKNKDDYQMKTLTSPSARSDDSDVA